MIAGVVAAAFSLPFDFVKTRIQKMEKGPDGKFPYKGPVDCAVKTFTQEGPLKFYTGFPTYCVRWAMLYNRSYHSYHIILSVLFHCSFLSMTSSFSLLRGPLTFYEGLPTDCLRWAMLIMFLAYSLANLILLYNAAPHDAQMTACHWISSSESYLLISPITSVKSCESIIVFFCVCEPTLSFANPYSGSSHSLTGSWNVAEWTVPSVATRISNMTITIQLLARTHQLIALVMINTGTALSQPKLRLCYCAELRLMLHWHSSSWHGENKFYSYSYSDCS